jgi:hypothetical protein
MALPQQIVRDLGGTVEVQLLVRPDASPAPTVDVVGPGGTLYVDAQTATVDSVNTTLATGAVRGDTLVAVASATGITVGREYAIGDDTLSPNEIVRVRGISGTQISLSRPLLNHVNDTAGFVGTRLSYDTDSTEASALFWNGHAKFTWTESTTTRHSFVGVESVLKRKERLATPQDLARRDPKIFEKLPNTQDIDELLQAGYDDTLEHMGGRFRARTVVSSSAFVLPTVYRALMLVASLYGPEWVDQREYYRTEWERAMNALAATQAVDNDQDSAIETHEGGFTTIKVSRA